MTVPVTEKGYVFAAGGGTGFGFSDGTAWWGAIATEETPEVAWPASIRTYERMETDSKVSSVMRAVTGPIKRTTYRVVPGVATTEVVTFVAQELGLDVLGQPPRGQSLTETSFSWDEHLDQALLMLIYGHSFFEQQYLPDPAANHYHLRKLAWRPPATIDRVDVAADGGLVGIHQYGMKAADLIGVDRLVAYVNQRRGGNWLGRSLLRSAYGPWLVKNPSFRTWAMTLDRNGLGVPIYKGGPIPEGMTDPDDLRAWQQSDQQAGLKLATQYRGGANAGGAVSNGADLELKGVTGSLPDSEKLVRYCDEQIAQALLANFLNLGGDRATGSYALSDTLEDTFTQSLNTIAIQIGDVATRHVVADLVQLNFPGQAAPRIVPDEIGQTIDGAMFQSLLQSGAVIPDERLEQYIRTRLRLPAADPSTRRAVPSTTAKAPQEAA